MPWRISSKASFALIAAQNEMGSVDARFPELGTVAALQCVQDTCAALGAMGADLGDSHSKVYQ